MSSANKKLKEGKEKNTKKDTQRISFIIDNRERALINKFETLNLVHNVKQLDLGDIIVEDNSNENDVKELFIIERKTVRDLIASVKDGRYKEQKIRLEAMKSNGECREILYIVEGDLNIGLNDDEIKTFNGSIISTQMRDSINVIRTMNINETVDFLLRLKSRCISNDCWEKKGKKNKNDDEQYLSTIKRKKGNNITKNGCQLLIISSVPGVSQETAKVIINKYGSIRGLFDNYSKLKNDNDKEKMLIGIELKKGKITEAMSKKIYNYLY